MRFTAAISSILRLWQTRLRMGPGVIEKFRLTPLEEAVLYKPLLNLLLQLRHREFRVHLGERRRNPATRIGREADLGTWKALMEDHSNIVAHARVVPK